MSRAQAVKVAVVICFRPKTLSGGDGKSDSKRPIKKMPVHLCHHFYI